MCHCSQFDGVDPAHEAPRSSDREVSRHYVKHGPIQLPQSEIRKTAEKTEYFNLLGKVHFFPGTQKKKTLSQ